MYNYAVFSVFFYYLPHVSGILVFLVFTLNMPVLNELNAHNKKFMCNFFLFTLFLHSADM